jgi:hypothetical protein
MRRGPATGRFLPRETADAVPLLMPQKNAHAVALGKHGAHIQAERRRRKVIAVMNVLRRELGLSEF